MPVTTRSMSAHAAGSQFTIKPSMTTTTATIYDGRSPSDSSDHTRPPKPTPHHLTKAFHPCKLCSCDNGLFANLVDSCVQCTHPMDMHAPNWSDPWHPQCDYASDRATLVSNVLRHARENGVVVIRATPMVGKTILLKLLGSRIARQDPDLEPVFFDWNEKRWQKIPTYKKLLAEMLNTWRELNASIRPSNPAARAIYLIDEAQSSYDDETFWTMLKDHHNTRDRPLFVLVCVYGADGISHLRDPMLESQAIRMHALHRIELRPFVRGGPRMLFQPKEVETIVSNFATVHHFQLEDGVVDYLLSATDGHPGMIGMLLTYLQRQIRHRNLPAALSPNFFHNLIVNGENDFIEYLSRYARGVWSPWSENYVQECLESKRYRHIVLSDVKRALGEVVRHPEGLKRAQKFDDAFGFCHKMGYLHTEKLHSNSKVTTFTFASPMHRRVAYRRLIAGPERDAIDSNLSLQATCINAIARFSPDALRAHEATRADGNWGVPEAAFQDELYACLNLELRCLPIMSEYSHTRDGRIDFYVADRRWGIEVLQSASAREIREHVARFAEGGKYWDWNIMDDYVILNFCPRSKLRVVHIEDATVRSHLLHVVVAPEEAEAKVYTHDKKLLMSLSLGEGRQRVDAYSTLLLLAPDPLLPNDNDTAIQQHQQESEYQKSLAQVQHILHQRDEQIASLRDENRKLRRGGSSVRRKPKT